MLVLALADARLPATAAAATPPQTDVMFVFDTSGSMEPVLEEAKAEIQNVMTNLGASLPNVQFGVSEVRDYGEFGSAPWRLDVPLTSSQAATSEGVSNLSAAGGGDAPEAYGRALWETDTNPNVGWRSGARHLIVLIADQVPHSPNVDEGIPEQFWLEPSPWSTGEELPGSWEIPGTQLREGEGLDFHAVLHQLSSDGKPLEMVDYHHTEGNYIHYWEYWAGLAGGTAVEASEGGKELANKLIGLVESAVPCAASALPEQGSPSSSGGPPTAVTPRFGQPGSAVVLTPAGGSRFCVGQKPYLGSDQISSLVEATPEKLAFSVPPEASSGLALSNALGQPGPVSSFAVDNFRYPWGFSIINNPGRGGDKYYDEHIGVTAEDLNATFAGIGPPNGDMYIWALALAKHELESGLCYGFSLLSWALYGDAHGAHDPLTYANSSGFTLSPGSEPYALGESSTGPHGLTHALLRAALSQWSPEARSRWQKITSTAGLEGQLNSAFQRGQPAVLALKFDGGGHAVLAFNEQKSADGVAVDVVDPNAPWTEGEPGSDYQKLQVDVKPNGEWSFNGTFAGTDFTSHKSGPPGSLLAVPEPRSPGGLTFWPESSSGSGTTVDPGTGIRIAAIGYSSRPGHGIPRDVGQQEAINDAPDNQVVVPSAHKTITVSFAGSANAAMSAYTAGPGFLDLLRAPSHKTSETIDARSGTMSVPLATNGTSSSVTSVVHGTQQTAMAQFSGRVLRPTLAVSSSGRVTLTTSGGAGKATLSLATYTASGAEARTRLRAMALHGRGKITRHVPRPRRHRAHHKRKK